MTAGYLAERLGLKIFALPRPEAEVTGGYAGDLLSWVMGRARPGDAWLTIMSNVNVAAVALLTEAACVILTEGVCPDEALYRRAGDQNTNLLGAGGSTFAVTLELGGLLGRPEGEMGG
jgi:hypothetical protein